MGARCPLAAAGGGGGGVVLSRPVICAVIMYTMAVAILVGGVRAHWGNAFAATRLVSIHVLGRQPRWFGSNWVWRGVVVLSMQVGW